ncbi:MAG: Rossmann-like domain-containing protein [Acidilobus sp.]
MKVVRTLVEEASRRARGMRLKRVLVGVYALVVLDDGSSGLAYVDWDWVKPFRDYEEPPEDAEDAVQLALSYDPVEAAIGVATINALSPREGLASSDPLDMVSLDEGMKVALVGSIRGYVRRLKDRVRLFVFETRPSEEEYVYPWYAEEELLPQMDLVIATGVTVVNKTIDRIVDLVKGPLILVGPSTPLWPEALGDHNGALGGSLVRDLEVVTRMVELGYGAEQLLRSRALIKVTRTVGKPRP